MPMSQDFENRLHPVLREIAGHFGTPFHIYDETGIRETGERLKRAFSGVDDFREFFAVKALPNPGIMKIMQDMGFGFDASSVTELLLSRQVGARGEEIMFTSNNTSQKEFLLAEKDGGCILNLDDISLIPKVPRMPELICFRYNPGPSRTGNDIIGNPEEAKYGVAENQIIDAYKEAMRLGAKRFGLHTMMISNERNAQYMVETAQMLLDLAERITEATGIRFAFINLGGGLGIPYEPAHTPLDLEFLGREVTRQRNEFSRRNGYMPALFLESGRFMTGPHGALVVTAINHKDIYRRYIGVDACMNALMRPAIYGAYHHITVFGKEPGEKDQVVDVVGSLCENNDKFAINRKLPPIEEGDILMIHDTGAHGYSMGFNYNGKLRPKELLLRTDGKVELIRREETPEDYFATLNFEKDVFSP